MTKGVTKGVTKAEGSTLEVGDTFESDMQMRWGEADSLNHMNHVVYFRYMEEGRIQSFAAAGIPAGMIFIPCRHGTSHHPDEWIEPEQAAQGCQVLLRTLLGQANRA